jgi:hypothetical protein
MCDHDNDGLDWEDIALIGALSESLAEERKECERIRKEMEEEQERGEEEEGEKDEEDDDPLK